MRALASARAYWRLSRADRALTIEAGAMLLVATALISTLPARRLLPWLGASKEDGRRPAPTALSKEIAAAVERAARHMPWRPLCFPCALAGRLMFAWRGYESTLVLGAAPDGCGGLKAHAWLVCNETIVIGAAGAKDVAPLARY